MFEKYDALMNHLHPVPRAIANAVVLGGIVVGGLNLAESFSKATGLDMAVEKFWSPVTNPVMYHIMRGVENAEGDNPLRQPDRPGRDFI